MNSKVKDSRAGKRIHQKGGARRIEPDAVAEALGAQIIAREAEAIKADPLSFLALHKRMGAALQSTGGRPARSGVSGRRKVAMTDQEWQDLEQVAELLGQLGVRTTAGQVAGFLIEGSLRKIKPEIEDIASINIEDALAAAANAKEPLRNLKPIAEELLRQLKLRRIREIIPGLTGVSQ